MTDLDPERALLGIVLDRPLSIRDIEDLTADDFADPRLGAIWDLMVWLDSQRISPEPVAVASHLSRIDMPGIRAEHVHDLYANAPIAQPPHVYAKRVRDRAVLRRLKAAAIRITQCADEDMDPDEAVEIARSEVDASSRATADFRLIGDEIDETIRVLEQDAPSAIPTPWADLDYLIQGWRPGGLYVIGARPAVGKSLMGLQAALKLTERGFVAMHSLEMPRAEVHARILAQMANVPMVRMDKREMTEQDWGRVVNARAALSGMRLAIDDRGAVRTVDIRSHARSLARRGPLAGIVVDYLQLMTAARGDRRPRHEQVAEWSRQLKLLAKEMSVPVLALSQLNRQSEGRTDKRPTMADLRESGALEQDSDVILLLHVEEDDPSTLHVQVAKNRQGSAGAFTLERRGEVARLDPWKWRPHLAAVPDERRAGG